MRAAACTSVTSGANSTINSNCDDLDLNGAGVVVINAGVTISSAGGVAVINAGTSNSINNNGIVKGNGGDGFHNDASLVNLNNSGTIKSFGMGGQYGVLNSSTITTLYNSGLLQGLNSGLYNDVGGTINTLTNAAGGTIGAGGAGLANYGTIETLTNIGEISSAFSNKVSNIGIITTLNNLNGGNALTYSGTLPTNYNIIVNSPSNYGKLSAPGISGVTTFGISSLSAGASIVSGTPYSAVLSGITNTQLGITGTSQAGTSNGYIYILSTAGGNIWDLIISAFVQGPSTTDTQSSVHNSAQKMRSIFNTAAISTNFANMNTYDCNLFDTKGMCISAGGRYTTVDNPSANSSSAVVVVGYKATPNIRIGGFLDQNFNTTSPTGIHIANKNPMMGVFAVWNQNEDRLGYQVKIANAYQDKDVTTTRDVVGSSEAGTGSTKLNTQSYVGELSYAFTFKDKTLVRPYLALRHTTIKQDAYTEDTTVTAPLTYAALEDKTTAALLGIKLNHALTPKANLTASLGVEQDLSHKVDQYAASGVSGLTSENFNDNIKRTRPVASLGAYYALTKTQRISGDVYYQQLPFQSTGSTTAYFNYMIGL